MWILTQNEKRIISTEGMEEINVADPMEGKTDYAVMIRKRTDGKFSALGFYRDKARAISILKEIMEKQASFYSCKGGPDMVTGGFQPSYIAIPPKVFKMPSDSMIGGQNHD